MYSRTRLLLDTGYYLNVRLGDVNENIDHQEDGYLFRYRDCSVRSRAQGAGGAGVINFQGINANHLEQPVEDKDYIPRDQLVAIRDTVNIRINPLRIIEKMNDYNSRRIL